MNFRETHLFQILKLYDQQTRPLDLFLASYFRAHKSLGSKDRKIICGNIYRLIRWRGLLDYLSQKPFNWEQRYALLQALDVKKYFNDSSIPPHVRVSFPKEYFQLVEENYGLEKALDICLFCNEEAPTFIRANTARISRDELFLQLEKKYSVSKSDDTATGIIFHKKINFFDTEEFRNGFFEVQDEGSVCIAGLVGAKPNEKILDYCSGSGGKSLAFVPGMQGRGQIYLHDIREKALLQATRRLKRAGVQNAQFFQPSEKYFGKMDAILLDVPCSGSGTLRRNPDMKWKFSKEGLITLVATQRKIFEEALPYLRPGGRLIYSTCSIFPQENQEQVEFFRQQYGFSLAQPLFSSLPKTGKMDGFFGAVLK